MKLRHLLPLFATLAVVACTEAGCANGAPFKWPDVAKCGADVGNLVGVVTQILLNDTGATEPSPATKDKLEQLGRQYGASAVVCLVDQLTRDWTAIGASASAERFNAGMRGKVWLADTGTQIQRGD